MPEAGVHDWCHALTVMLQHYIARKQCISHVWMILYVWICYTLYFVLLLSGYVHIFLVLLYYVFVITTNINKTIIASYVIFPLYFMILPTYFVLLLKELY